MRRFWIIASITLLIIIGLGGGVYFYNKQHQTTKPTETQTTTQPQQKNPESNGQNQTVQPQNYPVLVYFSKSPESADDPSKVFAVDRKSPDLGVAKFAINQLIAGPTKIEESAGYFTQTKLRDDVSNCGGADFTLVIKNDVATLQFCKAFDHVGVMSDGQAESEIKATLKQFDNVQKVIILNKSGDCEFNLSGLNLCKQ